MGTESGCSLMKQNNFSFCFHHHRTITTTHKMKNDSKCQMFFFVSFHKLWPLVSLHPSTSNQLRIFDSFLFFFFFEYEKKNRYIVFDGQWIIRCRFISPLRIFFHNYLMLNSSIFFYKCQHLWFRGQIIWLLQKQKKPIQKSIVWAGIFHMWFTFHRFCTVDFFHIIIIVIHFYWCWWWWWLYITGEWKDLRNEK